LIGLRLIANLLHKNGYAEMVVGKKPTKSEQMSLKKVGNEDIAKFFSGIRNTDYDSFALAHAILRIIDAGRRALC